MSGQAEAQFHAAEARVGRDQQRYDEAGHRLVGCSVPVRLNTSSPSSISSDGVSTNHNQVPREEEEDKWTTVNGRTTNGSPDEAPTGTSTSTAGKTKAGSLECLLIRSNKRKEWIFPKGGWEDDESIEKCCQREAYEEAGVRFIRVCVSCGCAISLV